MTSVSLPLLVLSTLSQPRPRANRQRRRRQRQRGDSIFFRGHPRPGPLSPLVVQTMLCGRKWVVWMFVSAVRSISRIHFQSSSTLFKSILRWSFIEVVLSPGICEIHQGNSRSFTHEYVLQLDVPCTVNTEHEWNEGHCSPADAHCQLERPVLLQDPHWWICSSTHSTRPFSDVFNFWAFLLCCLTAAAEEGRGRQGDRRGWHAAGLGSGIHTAFMYGTSSRWATCWSDSCRTACWFCFKYNLHSFVREALWEIEDSVSALNANLVYSRC